MYERVLPLNACSAEFCPHEGFQDLLAVGMYELDEATQTRHGRLLVTEVHGSGEHICLGNEASHNTSGIFNMRWMLGDCAHSRPTLATAHASGHLTLMESSTDGSQRTLMETAKQLAFEESMAVSIAIDIHHTERLGSTSAAGEVAILRVTSGELHTEERWQGHDLEAWNCCFDCWEAQMLYTGGDDCALKGWDLRQPPDMPSLSNRKSHGAGVCCLNSSPHKPHVLATGSYDEKIRLWDTRSLRSPVDELGLGGGVWNLKWHPRAHDYLLAACMHNGFAVVGCKKERLSVAHEYPFQKTLGYGADWGSSLELPVVATVSFYDRLLHIWTPQFGIS